MSLPRNLTGRELAKALGNLGYKIDRQKGSHIRITTDVNGTHHLTVPDHRPIKVGTLAAIIRDVGQHHGLPREQVLKELFG